MARMPGAVWRPMPGSSTSRISSYDILCYHTMVGSLAGTDSYFRSTQSGTNSHFGVGGDGTIYQWVDTDFRSGANLNGNYHIISVETADMGAEFGPWSGSDVPAWNAAQIAANARIAAWVHATHGIPLVQIPDAKVGRKGVGYHRLGVIGYMVAGAEQWSGAKGKVCPGDRRIAQIPSVINLALTGEQENPLMASTLSQEVLNQISVVVRDWVRNVLRDEPLVKWTGTKNADATIPAQLRLNAEGLAAVYGDVQGLKAAVAQLNDGTDAPVDLDAVFKAAQDGARSVVSDLRVVPATEVDQA